MRHYILTALTISCGALYAQVERNQAKALRYYLPSYLVVEETFNKIYATDTIGYPPTPGKQFKSPQTSLVMQPEELATLKSGATITSGSVIIKNDQLKVLSIVNPVLYNTDNWVLNQVLPEHFVMEAMTVREAVDILENHFGLARMPVAVLNPLAEKKLTGKPTNVRELTYALARVVYPDHGFIRVHVIKNPFKVDGTLSDEEQFLWNFWGEVAKE